jgi:hypothetical protein
LVYYKVTANDKSITKRWRWTKPFHTIQSHNSMFLAHSILTLGTVHLIRLVRQKVPSFSLSCVIFK